MIRYSLIEPKMGRIAFRGAFVLFVFLFDSRLRNAIRNAVLIRNSGFESFSGRSPAARLCAKLADSGEMACRWDAVKFLAAE